MTLDRSEISGASLSKFADFSGLFEYCDAQELLNHQGSHGLTMIQTDNLPSDGDRTEELSATAGGPVDRIMAEADDHCREVMASLPRADWKYALAYRLKKYLSEKRDTALTRDEIARAYCQGCNHALGKNMSLRFEPGKDGKPDRLVITENGKSVEIELSDQMLKNGQEAEALARVLDETLEQQGALENPLVRTSLVRLLSSLMPLPGEDPGAHAGRVQLMTAIINERLHKRGIHMSVKGCKVHFYRWDERTNSADESKDLVTPIDLSAPPTMAEERVDEQVNRLLADRRLLSLNREFCEDFYACLRNNGGDELVRKLNEKLHERGFHIELKKPDDPNDPNGVVELHLYRWDDTKKEKVGPPLAVQKLDQQIDIAARAKIRVGQNTYVIAEALSVLLNEPKFQNTIAAVFWKGMLDEEQLMQEGDLTSRRMLYFMKLRDALRKRGFDVEYDPAKPDQVTFYKWDGTQRVGPPMVFYRPAEYDLKNPEDPARKPPPETPDERELSERIGMFKAISAVLLFVWLRRKATRWLYGDGGTSPGNRPGPSGPGGGGGGGEPKPEPKPEPRNGPGEGENPGGEKKPLETGSQGEGTTRVVKGRTPGSGPTGGGGDGRPRVATGGGDIRPTGGGGETVVRDGPAGADPKGEVFEEMTKEDIRRLRNRILADSESTPSDKAIALKVLDGLERGDPAAKAVIARSQRELKSRGGFEGKGVSTALVVTTIAAIYLLYQRESSPDPYVPRTKIG